MQDGTPTSDRPVSSTTELGTPTLREKIMTFHLRLRDSARLMVGVPNYDAYLAHMREIHPDKTPMTYEEFFTNRQNARYGAGGKGGFKCC